MRYNHGVAQGRIQGALDLCGYQIKASTRISPANASVQSVTGTPRINEKDEKTE